MIIFNDNNLKTVADLQVLIIKICIKDKDLKSFKYYLKYFDIDPSIETNYFIRYARRCKATEIIKYLATLKDVQVCMNMTEIDLLVKYLYN